MSISCFSRKVIIKLMNPKKDQLVLGRGKHADIDMCSCLQWLLGMLCNSCSGLTCGPPGDRGESWLPHYWYHHDKGIHKSLLFSLAAGFRFHATEQSWTVVPGMHGTHCKHSSLIPPLVSNNNLALLGYGSMCAGTLVHIARYQGKTSNNKVSNNRLFKL